MTQSVKAKHFNLVSVTQLPNDAKLYSWLTSSHYVELRHETRFGRKRKLI